MSIFKKLFCSHEWKGKGFSYAGCIKCSKSKHSPEIAQAEINRFTSGMVDAGRWSINDVNEAKSKRGLL